MFTGMPLGSLMRLMINCPSSNPMRSGGVETVVIGIEWSSAWRIPSNPMTATSFPATNPKSLKPRMTPHATISL